MEHDDDPFAPLPIPCFTCGVPIPNGEGRTPDGLIAPGIIGRVYCPACWNP